MSGLSLSEPDLTDYLAGGGWSAQADDMLRPVVLYRHFSGLPPLERGGLS
jgi:hypothetical protein